MSESSETNGPSAKASGQQPTARGRNRILAGRVARACLLLCLIVQSCVWPRAAWSGTSDELRIALQELEQMRWDGKFPPYHEAERRTAKLLKEYPDPGDQGQIWFELVHIYGQTAGPPQRIIDYAKKALEFPHDPPRRIRLYSYWSDGLFFLNADGPLPERRRAAAAVRLDALMELRKYNLPDNVPELLDATPPDSEEARERARVVKELDQQRDRIFKQMVWMYTLRPFATEEIRELATEKTNDRKLVNRLMQALEREVEASIAKYGPDIPPGKRVANGPLTPGTQLFLLANLLVIVIAIAFFVVRRWRIHGRGQTA